MRLKCAFRGFYPNDNGKQKIIVLGISYVGDWIFWDAIGRIGTPGGKCSPLEVKTPYSKSVYHNISQIRVVFHTIKSCTNIRDAKSKIVFVGDIVELLDGTQGVVETDASRGVVMTTQTGERLPLTGETYTIVSNEFEQI